MIHVYIIQKRVRGEDLQTWRSPLFIACARASRRVKGNHTVSRRNAYLARRVHDEDLGLVALPLRHRLLRPPQPPHTHHNDEAEK